MYHWKAVYGSGSGNGGGDDAQNADENAGILAMMSSDDDENG